MLRKGILTATIVLYVLYLLFVSAIQAGESRYVVTPPGVVVAMLDAAEVTDKDIVVDLGCGDGRIPIIAATRYGVKAVGVELDPKIVDVARRNVERNGLSQSVTIYHGDVLRMKWNKTRKVVTVYLDRTLLSKLRPVLERLPAGSRVVSHQHAVPGWKQVKPIRLREHRIFRYRVTRETRREKVCGPNGCQIVDVPYTAVKGY